MSERFSSLQTEPYSKYCEFASTTPSKLEIFTGLRRYNILYVKVSHTYILSIASGHDEFCLFHASSFQVLLYRDNAQEYLVAWCQVLAVFFAFVKIYCHYIFTFWVFLSSLGPEGPRLVDK